MYLHTEAHNVGQIKHDWALDIEWLVLHWITSPALF